MLIWSPTLIIVVGIALQKSGTFHLVNHGAGQTCPLAIYRGPTDRAKAWFSDTIYLFQKRVRETISAESQITSKFFHMPDWNLTRDDDWQSGAGDKGQLYTPPAHLLTRRDLPPPSSWGTQQVEEKLLTLNDLTDADRIYACNALRGLYELNF